MTPIIRAVFVLLVAACLICLGVVIALFSQPTVVRAQDIPPCVDADAFVAELVKDGALEGPSLDQQSRHADKVRLVEFRGVLWALLTNRGCLVVKPIPLDYAKDRGDPA